MATPAMNFSAVCANANLPLPTTKARQQTLHKACCRTVEWHPNINGFTTVSSPQHALKHTLAWMMYEDLFAALPDSVYNALDALAN
jgi:hypothetical protein